MTERPLIRPGAVVQVRPGHDSGVGGCFGVVDAVKDSGCVARVAYPAVTPGSSRTRMVRLDWADLCYIGTSRWAPTWAEGPKGEKT